MKEGVSLLNITMKIILKEKEEILAPIFRILSKPISSLLIKYTNITPNQITIIGFMFAIAGAIFLARGEYQSLVIGSILAFISLVCDAIDGDIARTKKLGSKKGKWLDAILGWVSIEILTFALVVGINNKLAFIFGLLAMICFPMQYLFVHFYKSEVVGSNEPIAIGKSGKLEFLRYIYGDTWFFTLLLIFCLINRPIYFILSFAIFGNLFWMGILFVQYLSLREIK